MNRAFFKEDIYMQSLINWERQSDNDVGLKPVIEGLTWTGV